MPKDIIDYSNTIIYKIVCNDNHIKDIYVGHTTNFIKRKYQHKILCNSGKKLKLYDLIRQNGGWDNWTMTEIAKYNCQDSTEARIREQEHYDVLNTTLHSLNPISNSISNILSLDINVNKPQKYYCQSCNFKCSQKCDWERHILRQKHLANHDGNKMEIKKLEKLEKNFFCECGKKFKTNSGLWKHSKKCIQKNNNSEQELVPTDDFELTDKEIIKELLKQTTKLIKVVENGTHNTTNSHNNNKTFNLSVFLNETCKDAMNISDFVSSIKVNLEDLETTGRQGYVQGITNIVLKNLNNVEQHMRPLHCSDFKREVLYIKDNDEWTKETDEKPILTKAIKTIANENIKQIKNWRDKYPDCSVSDSRKNDLYLKIVSNSMNGLTKEEGDQNINKIISNVAKEVTIDKDIK
jgi:hypothetical protein